MMFADATTPKQAVFRLGLEPVLYGGRSQTPTTLGDIGLKEICQQNWDY